MDRICSVPSCKKSAEKRGWCGAHYWRWRQHGNPEGGRTPNGEMRRFLETFSPRETDECVHWPYAQNGNGYGVKVSGIGYPHRFVCERFHGASPSPSHEVAHGCGQSLCINPRHLRWATHVENENDKLVHGTRNVGERGGGAKLTESQAREIAASRGTPSAMLAARYGISQATIQGIRAGRTWKHLEVAR